MSKMDKAIAMQRKCKLLSRYRLRFPNRIEINLFMLCVCVCSIKHIHCVHKHTIIEWILSLFHLSPSLFSCEYQIKF